MNGYQGEKFLLKLYDRDLYNKKSVKHSSNISDNKFEAVKKYLDRLDGTKKAFNRDKQGAVKYLKNRYYDKYVIKDSDIPINYLKKKKKMCDIREVPYSEKDVVNKTIQNQKKTLDRWLDYLMSDDIDYPMWVRYWAFQGMLKLGNFNFSNHSFLKRSRNTPYPFARFNEKALRMSMDLVMNYYSYDDRIADKELDDLALNGNFGKIYARCLWICEDEFMEKAGDSFEGKWKLYACGSDSDKLFSDLDGKFTYWCIDDEAVASEYLDFSNVYVYYTKSSLGDFTVPRVAVVVEDGEIIEIRGVSDPQQNVESEFFDIVEDKLDEFCHDSKFDDMLRDMRRFYTIISNDEISIDDLKFIYELDSNINCFGRGKDFKIARFLRSRDKKKDYGAMYGCSGDLVGDSCSDLSNDIYLYLGNIVINDEILPDVFHCPSIVLGNFEAPYLKNSCGLENLY